MVIHHVTHEALESFYEILDARSPAEFAANFAADRLPATANCPARGNEERHRVGLLYKPDSFAAHRIYPEGITLNTSSIERLGEALAEEAYGYK